MRLDFILSTPTALEGINEHVMTLVSNCAEMSNSNHIVVVEAKDAQEAARYCSFIRVLRRQLVPGLDLSPMHVQTLFGANGKLFWQFEFFVEFTKNFERTIDGTVNGWELDVETGRQTQITLSDVGVYSKNNLRPTCAFYKLSDQFFEILEKTRGPEENAIFGETLFGKSRGECFDETLHDKLGALIFFNRTNGNVKAAQYFQEVFLLAASTGRRVIGYRWDARAHKRKTKIELVWFFSDTWRGLSSKTMMAVDLTYQSFSTVVPFLKYHVDRFLMGIKPKESVFLTATDFVELDRANYAHRLEEYINDRIPRMKQTMDWRTLAKPAIEEFKIPQLTKVYERFRRVDFLLDRHDEENINQVRAIYSTPETDMIAFVAKRLDSEKKQRFSELFQETLPLETSATGRGSLASFQNRVVVTFGEEVYAFLEEIKTLRKKGIYASETLFVDVEGFCAEEKVKLTLVFVGLMKKKNTIHH